MSGTVLCVDLPGPVAASDLLLREAEAAWARVREDYARGCLAVGRLLRRYVMARAREADRLPECQRLERELTRERAVEDAAARLRLPVRRCNEMLRVAGAVEVLAEDGDIGRLSWDALRYLSILAERMGRVCRTKRPGEGETLPSEGEAWRPRQIAGHDPQHFFRRAVREDWTGERIREAMRRVPVPRKGPSPRQRPLAPLEILRTARAAHPRDLAEMVLALIEANPEAAEVTRVVLSRLQRSHSP